MVPRHARGPHAPHARRARPRPAAARRHEDGGGMSRGAKVAIALLAALVVGLGAALAVVASDDGDDEPASTTSSTTASSPTSTTSTSSTSTSTDTTTTTTTRRPQRPTRRPRPTRPRPATTPRWLGRWRAPAGSRRRPGSGQGSRTSTKAARTMVFRPSSEVNFMLRSSSATWVGGTGEIGICRQAIGLRGRRLVDRLPRQHRPSARGCASGRIAAVGLGAEDIGGRSLWDRAAGRDGLSPTSAA